jgi:hypothetical protein
MIKQKPELISYKTLRRGVGWLGILLPVILVLGSMIFCECREVQRSISAYYHTGMRNVFVGIIFAIAFFLFAYRGYDRRDALAGNLASVLALGVIFFPTSVGDPLTNCIPAPVDNGWINTVHFYAAAGFFLVLVYFSLCLFTIKKDPVTRKKLLRNKIYRASGYGMLACLILILFYYVYLEDRYPVLQVLDPIFWLETIALWLFGFSWLIKGETMLTDDKEYNMD